MIILSGSQFTYVDVDSTLLMWNWPEDDSADTWIELDPWGDGKPIKLAVNTAMVEQIKKHAARGHVVVVWSQGGWKWAETAVNALNLGKYVSLVIEKPTWVYDDKAVEDFMPKAQWVGNKEWLK